MSIDSTIEIFTGRVLWTIEQGANPATCSEVGGVDVKFSLTTLDGSIVLENTFSCVQRDIPADYSAPDGSYIFFMILRDTDARAIADCDSSLMIAGQFADAK